PADGRELIISVAQALGDDVWTEAVRQEAAEDRPRADAADDVGLREAVAREEMLERAKDAELVEEPFGPAARETDRDLAASAARRRRDEALPDGLPPRPIERRRDDATEVEPPGLEREGRAACVAVHHEECLLAPDDAREVVLGEEPAQDRQARAVLGAA